MHDPQPLPLISHFADREMPWLWQCHVDLSSPYAPVWTYLRRFIEQYDAAIFSLPEYGQDLPANQHFVTPAIDPFSAKNRELSDREIREFLGNYKIPTDRPLVTQISRFDHWKDPMGVIEAFRKAREHVECTLVLLGNNASDDPEGGVILEQIKDAADEGIIILAADYWNLGERAAAVSRGRPAEVDARRFWSHGDRSDVERRCRHRRRRGRHPAPDQGRMERVSCEYALWGGRRIVQLLKDSGLRKQIGSRAKESVRQNFLMSRLLEDWLDLLSKYERPVV